MNISLPDKKAFYSDIIFEAMKIVYMRIPR